MNKNVELYLFKSFKYLAKIDDLINQCGCSKQIGGNQNTILNNYINSSESDVDTLNISKDLIHH